MLFILITMVATSQGFDVLGQTDDEWIVSGYTIQIEAQIDPMDFAGENLRLESTQFNLGSRAFFVDTSEGEKWRVVLLFRDKIVLLQEDREDQEFMLPSPGARRFSMSQNGRWALVEYRSEDDNDLRVDLVDLDSGGVLVLDGLALPRSSWIVSDNGSLMAIADNFCAFLDPFDGNSMCVEYPLTQGPVRSYSRSTDGSLSVMYEQTATESMLVGFDSFGIESWCVTNVRGSGWIRVSPAGDLIYISRADGLLVIEGNSGVIIDSHFADEHVGSVQFNRDGSMLAFEIKDSLQDPAIRDGVVIAPTSSDLEDYVFHHNDNSLSNWIAPRPRLVTTNGTVLFMAFNPAIRYKWGLLKQTGELIWVSASYKPGSTGVDLVYGNRDVLEEFEEDQGYPHAISSQGLRFVYSDDRYIYVATIAEDL